MLFPSLGKSTIENWSLNKFQWNRLNFSYVLFKYFDDNTNTISQI